MDICQTMEPDLNDVQTDSSLETDGAPLTGYFVDYSKFYTDVIRNNETESKRKRDVFEDNSNVSESSFELGTCSDTGDRHSSGRSSSSSSSDGSVGLESTLSDLDISDEERNSPSGHNKASSNDLVEESHSYSSEDNQDSTYRDRRDPAKSKVLVEVTEINDGATLNGYLEPVDHSNVIAHEHEANDNPNDFARESEGDLADLDPLSDNTYNIDEKDKDGDTMLHVGIVIQDKRIAIVLIQISLQQQLNIMNNLFQTPLHLAVLTKQADVVRALLEAGACPHLQDIKGRTPVHIACERNDAKMLRFLLKSKCLCSILNERLETEHPTEYCPRSTDLSSPKSTIFGIADYEGQFPIHVATGNGGIGLLKVLVSNGDDINRAERKSGRTALHMATELGDRALVEYLLDQETIQIDQKTRGDETAIAIAFHRMEKHGHDIYELLKDKGAKVDFKYFAKFGVATAEINKRFRSVNVENVNNN